MLVVMKENEPKIILMIPDKNSPAAKKVARITTIGYDTHKKFT